MTEDDILRADFLVLGSGIAGLRAALGLARHGDVLVVTKDQPTESNTGYAQGGVAVALVAGCRFLSESGAETAVLARATLLATGGAGQVFQETTNPPVATGDGMAMARRAGASLVDMEFVQFHPTALAVPGAPRFLVSEAVRGEGAFLRNRAGDRFTDELAARDQVARAIARENREGRGPVALDLRHLDPERVRARFPRIVATCLRYGIDATRLPVPVTPAAHYVMGGVASDLHG